MPTWLSDPSDGFYLALFVIVLVTVMMWARNRTRGNLARAVVALAVALVVVACDFLVRSPREQSVARVQELVAALNGRNWDKFQANLSERFDFHGKKKKEMTEMVRTAVTAHNPRATVWDVKVPQDVRPSGPDEFLLEFEGKAEVGAKPYMAHFIATFVKDPDGQWRLQTFTPYNYVQKRVPETIPGLP